MRKEELLLLIKADRVVAPKISLVAGKITVERKRIEKRNLEHSPFKRSF
jgi:hypothetical protein